MKQINWKVRLRSYPFWVALFGFVGLIISNLGVMDIGSYEQYVQSFLLVLIAGGIVSDPTTEGYKDSKQALSYTKPNKDVK
ncbi:phage holin [Salipaludibacillus sp. CF4.18]|uniref:phage holin n=1 Tax=Salipaludibacillus sp. CF4.18 TaxID=3373081 RepID=UPI003EE67BF6